MRSQGIKALGPTVKSGAQEQKGLRRVTTRSLTLGVKTLELDGLDFEIHLQDLSRQPN